MSKFYLTINGFVVQRQTWDDPLQLDGKGDEVYIRSTVKKFDRNGQLIGPNGSRTSATLGDINNQPGRVLAGRGSGHGGLRTNDVFPTVEYANVYPTRPPKPDEFTNAFPPYRAWEGDIGDGEVVYFSPSIWEFDNGGSVR